MLLLIENISVWMVWCVCFWCDVWTTRVSVSESVRSHADLIGDPWCVCFFQQGSTSEWASFSDSVARVQIRGCLGSLVKVILL